MFCQLRRLLAYPAFLMFSISMLAQASTPSDSVGPTPTKFANTNCGIVLTPDPERYTVDFEEIKTSNRVFVYSDFVVCLNGDITFDGGEVLSGESFLVADKTVVYGTSFYCDSDIEGTGIPCQSSITINFNNGKMGRQYLLTIYNGEARPQLILVTDSNNLTQGFTLNEIGAKDGSSVEVTEIGALPVTFIQISSSSESWNFSIDHVEFTLQ